MKIVAIFISLVFAAGWAGAQSLTDIAGKTRKKDSSKDAKVYTNTDLKNSQGNITSSTKPQPAAPAAGETEGEEFTRQDKLNWDYFNRIKDLDEKIARLENEVIVADADYQKMRTQFYSESSGSLANAELKPAMDQAWAKWDATKKELAATKEELEKVKEQARKSNVPAAFRDLRQAPPEPPARSAPAAPAPPAGRKTAPPAPPKNQTGESGNSNSGQTEK